MFNKIFCRIKYVIEVLFNIHLFFYKKSKKKKIVLILTPQYLNFGDHAIAMAEKQFLKQYYPQYEILEINLNFYQMWKKRVIDMIGKNDLIIITGGGYMGSLWEELQTAVEDILISFPNHSIILAPQTIYFNEKEKGAVKRFRKIIEKHGAVYGLAREKNTIHFMEKQLGMTAEKNCMLFPDMVLLLRENRKKQRERREVGVCLREDIEGIMTKEEYMQIENILNQSGCHVRKMKMLYEHVEIPVWLRTWMIRNKLRQFSEKKIVITDRLHGMVFAAITVTPCIVFDNVSKKVSGVYECWMKELSYIRFVNNIQEFQAAWEELIHTKEIWCEQKKQWQNRMKKAEAEKKVHEIEEWLYGKDT